MIIRAAGFSSLSLLSVLVATLSAQDTTHARLPTEAAIDSQHSIQVWVNTTSYVYHCPGTRYYGTTKAGQFMAETDARNRGFRPAYGRACAPLSGNPVGSLDSASQLRAAVTASATALNDSGPRQPVRPTFTCSVRRIVDGDTVDCAPAGRIRLIGMDTPERGQVPFGAEAASVLATLIPPSSDVQVEQDVEARDRYGRALGYIWHDDMLVNWRMVREGWAMLLTYPPNVQYVEWFTQAQRRAREERRGFWATGGFECPPVEYRRRRCA